MHRVLLSAAYGCGAGDGLDKPFGWTEVAPLETLARDPDGQRAFSLRSATWRWI